MGKHGTTFMDTLQSQISNTYCNMNTNTNEDFSFVKSSEFKNENEYKKHFVQLANDKKVNCIMNHIDRQNRLKNALEAINVYEKAISQNSKKSQVIVENLAKKS